MTLVINNPISTAIPVSFPERTAPILLRAQGLSKAFGGQIILDSVNLELRQGEVVLLQGENGSGKTTLLNILTGNLEPDAGTIEYLADGTPRTYSFPRVWRQELNPFDHFTPEYVAREGIGRTWQDVRLFGAQSLHDNIAVAVPGHPGENPVLALLAPGRSTKRETAIAAQADAMLAQLGLAERASSSADKISLGQSKRIAMARAIAGGARILFLDEPLAGLDRQGISDVLAFLESLVDNNTVTLVIVEHVFNQPYLRRLVTTDWILAEGRLAVLQPQNTAPNPRPQTVSRPPWFSLLAGDDAEMIDEVLPRGAVLTRIRRPDRFQGPSRPILEISGLVVKRGTRTVLGLDENGDPTGLNLTLYEGEMIILQAPNGWGKSTLLDAIAGIIPVSAGEIRLDGTVLDHLPTWERVRKGLRALASDQNTFPSLRVKEVMQLVGNPDGVSEFKSLADRICSSLSGGERQRVALFAIPPGKVGIYDEPFSALDRNNTLKATTLGARDMSLAQLVLIPGHR
jgi:ABC-type branched-subunit amino acid transport system ATPase component